FNKTADIPQGNEIQLTTRASFENGEIFSIEDAGNGKVFLKATSPEGKVDGYLSVNKENRIVINTSSTLGDTERFELNYQAYSGYFTLKSVYNSKFVCADVFSGYSITADRDEASVWETFSANILTDTKPTPTPASKPMVEIYADGDYQGLSQTLSIGSYNLNDLKIGNDVLSSLKVPQGLKVTLYEHENFQGRTKTFTENASWVGDDFNDITSSIVVEPAPPSTPIPTDFTVEIGKVSGCIGDTVTVPVTFKNLKENIDACDFVLSYDRNSVELKSIEAGSIVANPSVNFDSNNYSGNIVFLFADETLDEYPIKKDGVFANLVFKIKSGASKIWLSKLGSFVDKNCMEMSVNFTDGAIICSTPIPSTPPPTPTPSITPIPTVTPSLLSPSIIKVDVNNLTDIETNVTYKIYNITNGTTALTANDWSRPGNVVKISKSYLNYYFTKFPDQNLYLNFNFTTGASAVLTVYTGSSPYVSMADSISYYVNSGDAKISLTPNGHFITSVKNGDNTLASRIDYTYDPSTQIFYIRKGYLNKIFSQTSQPLKLTVNFTGNDIKTVTIYPIPENPQGKAVAQLSIKDNRTGIHEIGLDLKLSDSKGNPIPNRTISLYGIQPVTDENGVIIPYETTSGNNTNLVTDNTGVAHFGMNVAAQEDYGTTPYIDFKASFAGDDKYISCDAQKRVFLQCQPVPMKYEELKGFYLRSEGEFVIQNNNQFKEWFSYIWDHNPVPERKITDEEFKDHMVVGIGKSMSQPDSDKLTLQRIIYSNNEYNIYYSYNPTEAGTATYGIYRMALIKKYPFTKVNFYENGNLVKSITQ
ncbi:MAG TPA: cohesin domain-containing protein, partial [Clostridia bacterium]